MTQSNPYLLNELIRDTIQKRGEDNLVAMIALRDELRRMSDPEFEAAVGKVDDREFFRYLMAAGVSGSRLIILRNRLEEMG